MIELFHTHITEQAIENVNAVLKSTWLNEGEYVKRFEQVLTDKLGLLNPVAVNSCTSALRLSLTCAGIKPGDEVILPAQTFLATGTAILEMGAKPVFGDIDPNTGCLDATKLPISDRTKAIIAVHWSGIPCDIDEIQKSRLPVIEDAAHALGATYKGKPIGSISDYTCFSFQVIKFLTTGDGGAVSTPKVEIKEELLKRKWFGIDKTKLRRHFEGDRDISVDLLGFKYNMNDITGAIGLGNLHDIEDRLIRRRKIAAIYKQELSRIPGLRIIETDYISDPSYWIFTVLAEDRKGFIQNLRDKQIAVSVCDRRIDKYEIFGGVTPGLSGQEYFDEHQVSIPCHDALSDDDVVLICETIKSGW